MYRILKAQILQFSNHFVNIGAYTINKEMIITDNLLSFIIRNEQN